MRSFLISLLAPLMLAACAVPPPATTTACTHDGPPPVLRTNLPVAFEPSPGHVVWPPNDGFAPATLPVIIQPGAVVDRFGDGAGTFFSPKGTGYSERALPYVCRGYAYHTYRVLQPLPALLGAATPWFGEPGGAVQVKTTACVNQLLATGALQEVFDSPPPSCPSS
jgi:hypothetical protein